MLAGQNKFLTIIKQVCPDIDDEDIKIFDDGWNFVVCVVNNTQAFRFPRRQDYTKILPREVAFLEIFAKQSTIKVPKLSLHKMPSGGSYVAYDFIPGVPFKKDIASTFNENELQEVAKQLGQFLSVLHTFPVEKAKELGFKELDSKIEWSNRLNKIKKVVYPHISKSERLWVTKLFTEFVSMISQNPFQNRLIHSDIMPEHIIVNPKTHKLTGIIDFGDVEIADPAYDFTFLKKYGQLFLDIVCANYSLPKDETFEKRRQFYEDRLVVTNLEHSLELKDRDKIELHKKQLTDYINIRTK